MEVAYWDGMLPVSESLCELVSSGGVVVVACCFYKW